MGKEYEVKEEYGRIIVSEYNSDDHGTEFPPLTLRDRMGFAFMNMPKRTKVLWSALFGIYGILYRIGSNRSIATLFGVLQIFTYNFLGIMWLVDLVSVIATGEVCLLKRKKYESYEELKRQGKKLK